MDSHERPEKTDEEIEREQAKERVKSAGLRFGSMLWETLKRDDASTGAATLAAILILNQVKKVKAIDGDYQQWNESIANTLVNLQFSDEEIVTSEMARPAEVKSRIIH